MNDTVEFQLTSYLDTQFDETTWRAKFDTPELQRYLISGSDNFLLNPTYQLTHKPAGFEGKPCLIFLLIPKKTPDRLITIVPKGW